MSTYPRTRAQRQSRILPFWECIPQFFLRPFYLPHVLWLVGLSLASLLSFLLPLPQGLDIFIGECLVLLAGARYAFGAMEACSRGLMQRPNDPGWQERDPERVNLPWKFVGITVMCGLAIGIVASFNPPLGNVLNWLWCLAIPAITMQLSSSNDFFESMNVSRWWHFIRHIGWPYLLLCFFLLLLLNGMPMVTVMLLPILGGTLTLPLVNFVGLYFLLIAFLLMGYVMYQYHEPLGLWALMPGEGEEVDARAQLEEDIGELMASGKHSAALALAEQALRDDPVDWRNRERVYKLLLLGGASPRLQELGLDYFERTLKSERKARALDIYRDLQKLGYAPRLDGSQSFALAQAADKAHDVPLTVKLISGFDKRFPKHPALPEVIFFSARLASERLRRDDQALALVRTFLSRYPQHPLVQEAQRYLQVLEKMQLANSTARPA